MIYLQMNTKRFTALIFLALTSLYLSLSPGAILGMGYTEENVNASNKIIAILGDWIRLQPTKFRVTWPRHGLFELIFELPFLLFSRLFFGASPLWADRILSIQPVIMTALICTVIFIWVRRITGSFVWGYVLALIAGFSTMLWPYAYIGLETTQSLFLLLSGYLALGSDRKRTWPHALLFALSCGLAVSLKSNGIFLAPAVAFLCFVYNRGKSVDAPLKTINWRKTATTVAIIVALYELSAFTRSLSPTWASSGALGTLKAFYAGSLLTIAFNVLSLLGSVNKGLLIFCPVIILPLLGLQKAYSKNSRIVIFAILTLGGLAGCSLFLFYTDETWGPRYLHSAVAPLLICLALTRNSIRFRLRREIPLIALALCGAAISFLGAFYYYGTMHIAATRSGQATIENLQTDPNWNHIRFNLMLLQVPKRGGTDPVPWTPVRHWWFEEPPDAAPLKTINLRDFAVPQSSLVRGWSEEKTGSYRIVWFTYLLSLVLGCALLVWLAFEASHQDSLNSQAEGN